MDAASQVYDLPVTPAMDCTVNGRIALPGVVMELHHYRFRGAQAGVFSSPRSFLDLALSPRPGQPCGGYDAPSSALGDILYIPAGTPLHTAWGAGEQTSICCGFDGAALDGDDLAWSDAALQASLDVRSPLVRDALRRIADRIEQPGKPPSVADLAADCGLSTRHFFRQFRAATGQTLTHYVTDRKIDRARQLLRQSEPAIKVIAWECGFDSAAAFSAAFRKATGSTPRHYREAVSR